jgi:SAM-dependent methyltransferase
MSEKYPMTWEEAILHIRSDPTHFALVRDYFFDDPLADACERYWQSTEWAEVRRLIGLGNGRTALDIGAGRGIASYALARDGWNVTALEPDGSNVVGAGAIRSFSERLDPPITVTESWGETLPFPPDAFDLVFCRQVLHHARDLALLCREIARVVKSSGLTVAVREHVLSRPEDLDDFLRAHPLQQLYGGEHAYLLADYVGSLRNAGLQITAILNPLASDINLYPLTIEELKRRIARKWRLPSTHLIPNWLLRVKGALMSTPGRPYSFVATKP